MDEFIKLLDPSLDYISHEIIGDTIFIRVASNKEEAAALLGLGADKAEGLRKGLMAAFRIWTEHLPVLDDDPALHAHDRKILE